MHTNYARDKQLRRRLIMANKTRAFYRSRSSWEAGRGMCRRNLQVVMFPRKITDGGGTGTGGFAFRALLVSPFGWPERGCVTCRVLAAPAGQKTAPGICGPRSPQNCYKECLLLFQHFIYIYVNDVRRSRVLNLVRPGLRHLPTA